MRCVRQWLVAIGCGAWLVWGSMAAGQEWTRFRGPNGAGVGQATVPLPWTDEDYNWKVELPGVGHSSPVLWGSLIFLTAGDEQSGQRMVLCLHASDGRQLWSRSYEAAHHRKHQLNSFASPTPVVDSQHVYICWGTPEEVVVLALDHQGRELWRTDLGPFRGGHGFGVSPILYEDLLVVPNEQEGESVLWALDRQTGQTRWKVARDSKVAYATPCVLERAGRPAELIFTNWEQGITGHDPHTGQTLWAADVFDKSHVETSIGSPVVSGDLVIGVCGWLGKGKQVIAVRPDSAGQKPPQEVWRIERSAPLCITPLVHHGLVFLWADEGIVTCAEAATGQVHWRQRVGSTWYASPIAIGDGIYNVSTDGEVVVLAADRQFQILARQTLGESSHSTPAVADGVLYLRTFSHLYSLGGSGG